jgi:hypothetical protein
MGTLEAANVMTEANWCSGIDLQLEGSFFLHGIRWDEKILESYGSHIKPPASKIQISRMSLGAGVDSRLLSFSRSLPKTQEFLLLHRPSARYHRASPLPFSPLFKPANHHGPRDTRSATEGWPKYEARC